MTSATLSTQGSFSYIRQRIGLTDGDELVVGSPFDYKRSALILIPEDIPEPDTPAYQQALPQVLMALSSALKGHTLVLFTSHSAIRGVRQAIRGPLETEGILVLAQGIDGSPKQVRENFMNNPKSVLLGTSSFWEGVDISGGVLKALVLPRLPFNVPTEPIFAARSSLYDEPFQQYAVPQAILRFRQGFGRLIRSGEDRGVIVVLDRRILSRSYGRAFLSSIPSCTIKKVSISSLAHCVHDWFGNDTTGH